MAAPVLLISAIVHSAENWVNSSGNSLVAVSEFEVTAESTHTHTHTYTHTHTHTLLVFVLQLHNYMISYSYLDNK